MKPTLQLRMLLLAWLLGLFLAAWFGATVLAFLLGVGVLLYWYKPSYGALGLTVFMLAGLYYHWYEQQFYASDLPALVGETVQLQAQVKGEPRVYGRKQAVRLQVRSWRHEGKAWQPIKGTLLWRQAPLPELSANDTLVVSGAVVNLINISADFDARAYWARWGIAQELIRSEYVNRPPPRQAPNQQARLWAAERLSHHLAEPHRTVALGMLVGLKEKLPKSLDAAFKEAGLTHLLVVSGTNVTLLILALSLLLKPLGPWWRYGFGVVAIAAYLYLVGFDPPALRASFLGVITGLALTAGYFCEYRNLLLLVAALLGLIDPHFITYDVSFWLSFAATFGLLLGVPVLYRYLKCFKWPSVRLLLAASISAQVAVFPLLIVQFGSFPYAGLITNIITEPLVPLIMLLGAGGIALGGISLMGLSGIWTLALWGCIQALISLAQLAARLPNATLPVWSGWCWGVVLLLFSAWALFSPWYQQHFWEPLEAELAS